VIIDAVLADGAGTSVAAYATWLGIPAITMTRSSPLHEVPRRHAYIRRAVHSRRYVRESTSLFASETRSSSHVVVHRLRSHTGT
jgi:hypothetical protein